DVNMLLEALDSLNCGLDNVPHTVRARTASPSPRQSMPCTLGDWAGEIIARPAFGMSKTTAQAHLVVLSVAELGFGDGAPLADVHARARHLGLELCAAEVGPQLRLQYLD